MANGGLFCCYSSVRECISGDGKSGNIYSLSFPLYMQLALTAHAFHHLFSSSSCFVFAWINNDMDLRLQVDI
ncbi:hypothetical protein Peur_018695 [Populus x canadensis]